MSISSQEEQFRQKCLEKMRTPSSWPQWPFLPLKRTSQQKLQLGYLVEIGMARNGAEANLRFVEGTFFFATPEQIAKAPIADIRQLVNDGWVVD